MKQGKATNKNILEGRNMYKTIRFVNGKHGKVFMILAVTPKKNYIT